MKFWSSGDGTGSRVKKKLKTIDLSSRKIEKRVAVINFGMNERWGDSRSCSAIHSIANTAKVANIEKAGFGDTRDVLSKRNFFINDDPKVTSHALGDIFTGQLQMHSTKAGSFRCMDIESLVQLIPDVLETAGLDSTVQGFRVAMHWIAAPEHLAARIPDRRQQRRQCLANLLRTHAMDQGQPARFVVRIKYVDQLQQLVRLGRGSDLDANGIANAPAIFHVGPVDGRSAHADPREVRGQIEPPPVTRNLAGLRLLVVQQQGFMRGMKIHALEIGHRPSDQGFHESKRISD